MNLELVVLQIGYLNLTGAACLYPFDIRHGNSQRDTFARTIGLGAVYPQDSVANLSLDQRQDVVVAFDFQAGRLLTDDSDLKSPAGFDSCKRIQLTGLRFAHARAVHTEMASG